MSAAIGLDHVGVIAADLGAACAAWQALGFAPTGLARQAGAATANHCIMLRQGYVELIGVVDRAVGSATVDRFLAGYAGIHVLTLAVADAGAAQRRLKLAGFAVELVASARPADPAAPEGEQARFRRLPLTDADPRLQLLQHLTPELVWQARFLSHPNHAVALEAVVVAAADPAGFAARLSRAAGVAVLPDPVEGLVLALPQGVVRVVPPGALAGIFPGMAAPVLPFVAGIVVRTDDGNAAVGRILPGGKAVLGGLMAVCGGVAVVFER